MTFTFEALVIWVDLFSDSPFYSFWSFFSQPVCSERISPTQSSRDGGYWPPVSDFLCTRSPTSFPYQLLLYTSFFFFCCLQLHSLCLFDVIFLHTPVILLIAEQPPINLCWPHVQFNTKFPQSLPHTPVRILLFPSTLVGCIHMCIIFVCHLCWASCSFCNLASIIDILIISQPLLRRL